jgi:hypothetical protein
MQLIVVDALVVTAVSAIAPVVICAPPAELVSSSGKKKKSKNYTFLM